ncbi:hypothetical protein M9H77_30808 [Catharanthus roseus]|uniref:Uncharacterized protein n=1 Tax=Catharanthus roseus TaxID=4058 RepID=A0ACB9ZYP6_CATRO|nr:hypothetical protein M9H77_30808 [Catharanthus roseus]
MLTQDPGVADVINEAWGSTVRRSLTFSFMERIRKTKRALRIWDKNLFGHIKEQIQQKTMIEALQSQSRTEGVLLADLAIQIDLDEYLKREEILWRYLRRAWNHTLITLIPKTDQATKAEQFRPIALCNVTLKVNPNFKPSSIVEKLKSKLSDWKGRLLS